MSINVPVRVNCQVSSRFAACLDFELNSYFLVVVVNGQTNSSTASIAKEYIAAIPDR